MMRERGIRGGATRASDTKSLQSELPALLLPQPKPRIEDPDCGRAPIVEPENRPQTPEEARDKRNPDNAVSHPAASPPILPQPESRPIMLRYALIFFVVALIAAFVRFRRHRRRRQ